MIKRKVDVDEFVFSFCLYSEWDGRKFFITLPDNENQGTITLMQYQEGHFTMHRMNELFCDRVETSIEKEQLTKIIWRYRKYINRIVG